MPAMAQVGLEERMAKIEGAFNQIDQRLGRVEAELSEIRTEVRAEIHRVEAELSEIRAEIHGLHGEIRSIYRLMIGVLIPMWATIIGAIIGVALTR